MTAAVGLVSALVLVTSTASSGSSGLIALSRENGQIYLMNGDGTGVRPLAGGTEAVWSPDGTQLAVCCVVGEPAVAVVRFDDGRVQHLVRGTQPAWAPDGRRLAVVRGSATTSEIYVVDSDGSNARRLTDDSWEDVAPTWSPDGVEIAYTSTRNPSRVIVASADGSGPERVVAEGVDPAWSPDGTRLAFSNRDQWRAEQGLYVASLTDDRLVRVGWEASHPPAWSADGARLLYAAAWRRYVTCTRCQEPALGILVANADGSGAVRLTRPDDAVDERPSWSLGERRVVFSRRPAAALAGSKVLTMNPNGSCETVLTTGLRPAWQPSRPTAPEATRCVAVGLRDATAPTRVVGTRTPFTLTVTVVNDGTEGATDVRVQERGSRRLTLLSASSTGGTCSVGTSAICSLETLAPGDETVVTFVARARAGYVLRSVTARSAAHDGNPQDNSVQTRTYVNACTILGTGGRDALSGTRGADVICGREGDDALDGHGGADRIVGNAGADRITGGAGRDSLFGDGGPDRILALDRERDSVACGPGADRAVADRHDAVARDCERVVRR